MSRQTSINVPASEPPSPEGMTCEWCENGAVAAIERLKKIDKGFTGSGMYMFACGRHMQLAKDNARPMTAREREEYRNQKGAGNGSI